jgi:hypothetical protein
MYIIFALFFPSTVNHDRLPAPVGSCPDLCIRWVHLSTAVIAVPPILKYVPSVLSLEELNECMDDVVWSQYALAYWSRKANWFHFVYVSCSAAIPTCSLKMFSMPAVNLGSFSFGISTLVFCEAHLIVCFGSMRDGVFTKVPLKRESPPTAVLFCCLLLNHLFISCHDSRTDPRPSRSRWLVSTC